jgi:aminoglycoside phosphotransferase (APT) family kinase protein
MGRPGVAGGALAWAAGQVGADASAVVVAGLRQGGNPWLLRIGHGGRTSTAILKTSEPGAGTEVAALRLAERHGIPAPRILGLDEGDATGVRMVLETVLPGRSTIPVEPTPQRLRVLGATAALFRAVVTEPTPQLPVRTRPISASDFSQRRQLGTDHTTPLLSAADACVTRLPVPPGPMVLVHGDLWQGNLLFDGDTLTGIVDWDMAGVGHNGIDLSSLRLDAALMFGPDAADPVLAGWESAAGEPAPDLAYWDAVTALNMPGDLAVFVPTIHDQGRPDLTAATLNARRDAFLRAALDRLSNLPD